MSCIIFMHNADPFQSCFGHPMTPFLHDSVLVRLNKVQSKIEVSELCDAILVELLDYALAMTS